MPEYFWYDPFNPQDWAGFQLQAGTYRPISQDEQGRLISQVLKLALVQWSGTYKSIETTWLRWATLEGSLLPTAEERQRRRAEAERQRADRLAAKLRALGVDPDEQD